MYSNRLKPSIGKSVVHRCDPWKYGQLFHIIPQKYVPRISETQTKTPQLIHFQLMNLKTVRLTEIIWGAENVCFVFLYNFCSQCVSLCSTITEWHMSCIPDVRTKAHIHIKYQLLWSDRKCYWTADFSGPLQYQISRKSITHFPTCYIHTVRNDTVPSRHPTLYSLLYPLQLQQVCTNPLVNVINISVNMWTYWH